MHEGLSDVDGDVANVHGGHGGHGGGASSDRFVNPADYRAQDQLGAEEHGDDAGADDADDGQPQQMSAAQLMGLY